MTTSPLIACCSCVRMKRTFAITFCNRWISCFVLKAFSPAARWAHARIAAFSETRVAANNSKLQYHQPCPYLEKEDVQGHRQPAQLLQLRLVVVLDVILRQTFQQFGGLLEYHVLTTGPAAPSPTLFADQQRTIKLRSVSVVKTTRPHESCLHEVLVAFL